MATSNKSLSEYSSKNIADISAKKIRHRRLRME